MNRQKLAGLVTAALLLPLWSSPAEAVYHAVVLETVADMALKTLSLNPDSSLPQYVLEKHYKRKHGANAYYGQG